MKAKKRRLVEATQSAEGAAEWCRDFFVFVLVLLQ